MTVQNTIQSIKVGTVGNLEAFKIEREKLFDRNSEKSNLLFTQGFIGAADAVGNHHSIDDPIELADAESRGLLINVGGIERYSQTFRTRCHDLFHVSFGTPYDDIYPEVIYCYGIGDGVEIADPMDLDMDIVILCIEGDIIVTQGGEPGENQFDEKTTLNPGDYAVLPKGSPDPHVLRNNNSAYLIITSTGFLIN
mgnify:CR=1 FL=1